MELFRRKEDVPHVVAMVDEDDIAAGDYNLSVSTYVEPRDTREEIDIRRLNADLAHTVERITRLRTEIDAIISEIEA